MITGKKIFGAFAVAVALFFFWPAVVGKWQTVSALRRAQAERQDLLRARQEILASAAAAYQEYTTKLDAADGQKFAALVPVRKQQAELISAIQDMAAGSGMTVNEVRISEEAGKGDTRFKALSMSLDMGGTYRALRTFLADLEQYVRLLNVDSIEVSRDTSIPGRLKFSVKASAYFLK